MSANVEQSAWHNNPEDCVEYILLFDEMGAVSYGWNYSAKYTK
jgi:hypothetical protein